MDWTSTSLTMQHHGRTGAVLRTDGVTENLTEAEITFDKPVHDRGRDGFRHPALRTVQAVFPHTALQSVVSSSRPSR